MIKDKINWHKGVNTAVLHKKLTIKQLKKSITWILIGAICLMIVLTMNPIEEQRKYRPFQGHNVIGAKLDPEITGIYAWMMDKDKWIKSVDNETFRTIVRSLNLWDRTDREIAQNAIEGNKRETIRLNILGNLLDIKIQRDSYKSIDIALLKEDIYEMWQHVSNGIPYDAINFRPETLDGRSNDRLIEAQYWDKIYTNDMEPLYNDEANNITTWYVYFYELMPFLLILLPILLGYASVNKDRQSGVLKLLLTQSVSRKRYYLSKWLSTVVQTVVIVLVPAIITGVYYGIKNGFASLKYPLTYLSDIFTRLVPIPNFIEMAFKGMEPPVVSHYSFAHMAPADNFESRWWYYQPHSGVDLIPFYQYALIALVLMILYVGFIIAVVQLISAIVNNEMMSLLVSGIVVGGTIGATHFLTIGRHYNVIPFDMFRVGRIIEGTQNVTVLSAVIILVLSTGLMLFGGMKYFERKAI